MKGKRIVERRLIPSVSFVLFLCLNTIAVSASHQSGNIQDTLWLRQKLQNGRIWIKKYQNITGHEFFLTEALAPGSLTIDGRTFAGQLMWYDIYNDRVVLMISPGLFIEPPPENSESFTISYMDSDYTFRYFGAMGYCQILYDGSFTLVRKHIKEIKTITIDNSNDTFQEEHSDYIVDNERFLRLRNRRDLFTALADRKDEIRHFIREQGLWINVQNPASIIPVLEYYDSLSER